MRILHVANFNTHKYGADLYSTDRKISAGLTRNGHFVYDFSYRNVCRNESFFRTTKLGTSRLNEKLLQACDTLRPELLLFGHSELIKATTLAEIKDRYPSIKVGLWYVDALFHRNKTFHIFDRLPYIDTVFATTGGEYLKEFATPSSSAVFIPNIVDSAVESQKSFLTQSYEHDFIFCGRDSNDAQRQEFIEKLNEGASKHLRCGFRGCLGYPVVTGFDYLNFLARSKMALNISRRNDVSLYSSDRLSQLVGNGLLTFSPKVPGMQTLFGDDEIIYFEDLDELLEKIVYYHKHDDESRRIAKKGWQRAHQCYNGERVTRYMLERLFDLPLSSEYEWRKEAFKAA